MSLVVDVVVAPCVLAVQHADLLDFLACLERR